MGGHGSHPLGWTVLALVVVAYAHVILELAAAGLALAIAARVMTAAPWRVLVDRVMSSGPAAATRARRDRSRRAALDEPVGGHETDRAGEPGLAAQRVRAGVGQSARARFVRSAAPGCRRVRRRPVAPR
jgi:hypothetical protein